MARLVTVQSVIDRARIHADQRDSSFITDDEALALFNECFSDLYDEQVDIDENYFVSETSFDISSATNAYDLPDDFYKSIGVDFSSTSRNEDRITLYPYNEAERNVAFTQSTNLPTGTIYLRYVPAPPTFTSTNQTFDGVSGWDRLLSLRLAIDMCDAEETNSDRLQRKYDQTLQRIKGSLDRDIGMPATVSDVSRPSVHFLYSSLKYRFYANTIQLISTEMLGAAVFGGPFV